jgi:hypothetical protein
MKKKVFLDIGSEVHKSQELLNKKELILIQIDALE